MEKVPANPTSFSERERASALQLSFGFRLAPEQPGPGWQATRDALGFAALLLSAPVSRVALENPIGCISTRLRQPGQIIQPHQCAEDAGQATCLWLKGLPPLMPTGHVAPRMVNGCPHRANQTDGGQNRLAPSPDRWKLRSTTYPGSASAMAAQRGTAAVAVRVQGQGCAAQREGRAA